MRLDLSLGEGLDGDGEEVIGVGSGCEIQGMDELLGNELSLSHMFTL